MNFPSLPHPTVAQAIPGMPLPGALTTKSIECSLVERCRPEAFERQDLSALAATSVAAWTGTRFRLKRWPSVVLLRHDPQRQRIAALLTRRLMTMQEISTLLGDASVLNLTFVRVLQASALLEVVLPAASDLAAPQASAPADGPRGTCTRLAQGVLHNIRRRFGL